MCCMCERIPLCQATGCEIPLIVESCIAAIEKNGNDVLCWTDLL